MDQHQIRHSPIPIQAVQVLDLEACIRRFAQKTWCKELRVRHQLDRTGWSDPDVTAIRLNSHTSPFPNSDSGFAISRRLGTSRGWHQPGRDDGLFCRDPVGLRYFKTVNNS
ncbi:hypothetical protein LIA77_09353 [Sarocladium implicatum]|nr:hypothetical protein LIA77_09353 [Sarocladium implicatum]